MFNRKKIAFLEEKIKRRDSLIESFKTDCKTLRIEFDKLSLRVGDLEEIKRKEKESKTSSEVMSEWLSGVEANYDR